MVREGLEWAAYGEQESPEREQGGAAVELGSGVGEMAKVQEE
jgi:hypothetical protein